MTSNSLTFRTSSRASALESRRHSLCALVALATLTVGAATVHADDRDDPFQVPHTKIGVGMLVGGYDVGPISGPAVGFHADLGRQMGPLRLYGEYSMLSIGESSVDNDDPVRGMLHRGGLHARYNFAEIGGGRRVPVQGVFWVDAGLGRHVIHWHEGGKLTRNDIGLGFGGQVNFRLGKDRDKPKIFGFYYAFRTTISRSPDADQMAPATCGGPCDEATPPSPNDLGLFFHMGLEWGKK